MTVAEVDAYIARSKKWRHEMNALRPILLDCGLSEAIKWQMPCFLHHGANIVLFHEARDHLALMFFKGSLLDDQVGLLGQHSQDPPLARRIEFYGVEQVEGADHSIRRLVNLAIEIEQAGLRVGPPPEVRSLSRR